MEIEIPFVKITGCGFEWKISGFDKKVVDFDKTCGRVVAQSVF